MRSLRILYAALDQTVPGTLGGSVHVESVATGLAALGHDVHVAVQRPQDPGSEDPGLRRPGDPGSKDPGLRTSGVTWHAMAPPLGRPELRWLARGRIEALAREMRADLIMERYYNFGGEGVMAADRIGIPAVLEVNAPIIDAPGSRKHALDRALLVEPMRRWRDRLCRLTRLFVTPSAEILPSWVDRRAVLEIEWGADVDRFRPDAPGQPPYQLDPDRVLCVFAGAFRAWHGAEHLSASLARLHAAGEARFGGVFVGDGPERAATERAAAGVPGIQFTGRVAHANMPAALARAQIGVAPFDPARHPPLQLGFYWSPLKIFEYMASGLPVVAPALPRLSRLLGHEREAVLYDPGDPHGLDRAIQSLADSGVRARLGAAARARVVRDYSWAAHCRLLGARLQEITST